MHVLVTSAVAMPIYTAASPKPDSSTVSVETVVVTNCVV